MVVVLALALAHQSNKQKTRQMKQRKTSQVDRLRKAVGKSID